MHNPSLPSIFQALESRTLFAASAITDFSPADDGIRGAIFSIGDVSYYTFNDGVHGFELWRRDPLHPKGYLVKDINPVLTDNLGHTASSFPTAFARLGSLLLFIADNGANGRELWRTNGTAAGTFMLADLKPGSDGLDVTEQPYVPFKGGLVLLSAPQMLFTNGSTAGTFKLPYGPTLFESGGKLYWLDDTTTRGVRTFDGAREGMIFTTTSIQPLTGATLTIEGGGRLMFRAYQQVGRDSVPVTRQIVSEGTVELQPQILQNTPPADPNPSLAILGTHNGLSYLSVPGRGLWALTGTAGGIEHLADGINPTAFFVLNGKPYFNVENAGRNELWTTDGTNTGTKLALSIDEQTRNAPIDFHHFNGRVAFIARSTGGSGWELRSWNGASLTSDLIAPVNASAINAVVSGDRLFFCLYDSNARIGGFFVTDGTGAGTQAAFRRDVLVGAPVMRINVVAGQYIIIPDANHTDTIIDPLLALKPAAPTTPFDVTETKVLGGTVFVATRASSTTRALWKTDGFTYTKLAEFATTDLSLQGGLGGVQFFLAGAGFWRTDGTAAGTYLVKNVTNGYSLGSIGASHFFIGDDAVNGRALWKTDGTATGTVLLKSFGQTVEQATYQPAVVAGRLYFITDDGTHGRQLWESDGTVAGTRMLSPGFSTGSVFTAIPTSNGALLAVGFTPETGGEVFSITSAPPPRIELTSRTLQIWGTSAADQIILARRPGFSEILEATVNGTKVPFDFSAINLIRIYAGAGSDYVDLTETQGPIAIRTSVLGGAGDDLLRTASGQDTIYGGDGNDVLYGGSDNDYLFGDAGNDRLAGGGGRDVLWTGLGRDTIVASLWSERRDADKDDVIV